MKNFYLILFLFCLNSIFSQNNIFQNQNIVNAPNNFGYFFPSNFNVTNYNLFRGAYFNNPGAGYVIPNPTGGSNVSYGSLNLQSLTTGGANSAFGHMSLYSLNTGARNTAVGFESLLNATTSEDCVAVGHQALRNALGTNNIGIGRQALQSPLLGGINNSGSNNIGIGLNAGGGLTSGNNNIILGTSSGIGVTSGNNNIIIGTNSSPSLTTGNNNVLLGRVTIPNADFTVNTIGRNMENTIVMADGNGTNRMIIDNNGRAGFGLGNSRPINRFEINSTGSFNGTPGLRFNNFSNTNFNSATPTSNRRVLTINNVGDVILVDDLGGVSQNCTTQNFIPINTATPGVLGCSQIFDNGSTSVGINTTGPFTYNNSVNPPFSGGTVPNTGTVRLDVNGVIRTVGIFATSDKKYKKEIKPIENAIEKIKKIEGKTYFWDRDKNKDMELDGGGHSGFIAQELEKVLPHLVVTDGNGNKAVNYIELMPYLVEAIKEQQTQINDLKSQIADNFKAQNQDLIELSNTKIINVSPNPSNDLITVSFNIEKSVQSAKLQVHDLNGNVISSLNVNDRENNITRTLQKDNFGKGIYIVSLVINGKSIDTKKIVFN